MSIKRHKIHKYHKLDVSYSTVWACALPDCSHFMPKHMEKLVEGKRSYCWSCGGEFILNPVNMEMDKPICDACRTGIKPDDESDDMPLSSALLERINKLTNQ